MSAQHTKSNILALVIIILFGSILTASWFPRSCPFLKKYLFSCSGAIPSTSAPVSETQKEIGRIPHQVVTNLATFEAKSEEDRNRTRVFFAYRAENIDKPISVSYLQFKEGDTFKDFALVSHPLLENIAWPVIHSTKGPYLYQRDTKFTNKKEFLASLPAPSTIAADKIAAKDARLTSTNYIPLESLTSLDGINYILTSRPPTSKDGSWSQFEDTYDFSSLSINKDSNIEGQLRLISPKQGPILLGEIHINYIK